MASKQFIDKLNEYNEWYSIPRANDYLPCPIVFENLDGSNFPVYQYITRFISVVFKNCNFNRSNFATCIFLNCTFEGCTFNYTEFKFNQIVHCKFCECDLTKFNVQYTDFWADFDDKCIFDNTTYFQLCGFPSSNIYADFTKVHFIDCAFDFLHGHKESLNKHIPMACPVSGEFIGWKKAYVNEEEYIVKLFIPEDAKRSSARSSKCRCNKATVLEIMTINGTPCPDDFWVFSRHDKTFTYKKNDTLIIDNFDENRWNECSTGIHFFMTKEEAIEY